MLSQRQHTNSTKVVQRPRVRWDIHGETDLIPQAWGHMLHRKYRDGIPLRHHLPSHCVLSELSAEGCDTLPWILCVVRSDATPQFMLGMIVGQTHEHIV